jgi:prepilin-type N-terminal cleavage/methylation domain-containing protein
MKSLRHGFSILELVTVLTIAGITAALSAGRIHALLVEQRVARAANIFRGNIEAAFAISARNRLPVRISWNAAKMQMAVTSRDSSIYYRKSALGIDDFGIPSSAITFTNNPVEVYPNGLSRDTLAILISFENNKRTIVMSRAGMVVVRNQ